MRRRHLRALTGVRFFAAAHVVVYHYGRGLIKLPGALARILDHGFAGVTLFFVLSGFILAYNHAGDAATPGAGAPPAARDFWAARFARIYPVYLVGLLLALPALIWPAHGALASSGRDLVVALTTTPLLLQGWIPRIAWLWNGPAWSLSAEALFYAAFPLLALAIVRLRRRGLLLLALAAFATSLAIAGVYLWIKPDGVVWAGIPTARAPWLAYVRYHPLARVPEFVLGMAAGRLFLLRGTSLARRRAWDWAAIAALLVTLALAASPVTAPFPMVHVGLLAPAFAVAIYGMAVAGGRGLLSRLLSTEALVRLGEASYALYILHVPVHDLLLRTSLALGLRLPTMAFFGAYLAAAIGASLVVNKTFEVPMRRIVRGWLGRRRAVIGAEGQAAAQAA